MLQQKPLTRIKHPKLRPYHSRLGQEKQPLVSAGVVEHCELVGRLAAECKRPKRTISIWEFLETRNAIMEAKKRYGIR
jgi:hypothetical protein